MNRRLLPIFCCLCGLAAAVAARAEGDWILLNGGNGYWTSNVDLPACRKLAELQKQPAEFKCVAFTPTGGSAILFNRNGYWADDIPKEAFQRLGEIARSGGTLTWLAFAPNGGWCIFYNQNGYHAHNIPEEALQKIRQLAAEGRTLKSITFLPDGGYALFWDRNGSWCRGVPEEALTKIVEVGRDGGKLKVLAVTPGGGWSFVWNRNAHWNRGIPEDAFHKLEEVGKAGGTLTMIAYMPVLDVAQLDPAAAYVLDAKPARRVKATLTTDIALPRATIDEWYIYAPQAPNLPGQRDVRTTFSPAGQVVREKSPLARPVIVTRLTDGRKSVHAVLTIEATLYSRRLRMLPGPSAPAVKDLAPGEAAHYTRATITSDIRTRVFRDWMRTNHLQRTAGERDLLFAHRVFAFIKHHSTYQYPTENHTASQVCAAGTSDCGGLSALFTGVMRANGVPARLLGGRWASSQAAKDRKVHVKAEFFAHGIGWVPVDAASAVGNVNGENAFFGNDAGDFLAFMDDEDLVLDSFVAGPKNFGVLQALAYWWRGGGDGGQSRFDDSWQVR